MFCFRAAFLATPIIIPNPDEKIKPFFQKKSNFFEKHERLYFLYTEKAQSPGGRPVDFVVYYIG